MTSGEKVALSLLAEICKLKAEHAASQAAKWDSPLNASTSNDFQCGYFNGIEFATRCFEKRLTELVGE